MVVFTLVFTTPHPVGHCPLIFNVVENQFIHIWNVYHNVKSALKYVNRIKIPNSTF